MTPRLADPIGHAWVESLPSPDLARRRTRLVAKAAGDVVELEGTRAMAELAARADHSADTVLSVMALCSVPHLPTALAAIGRVLRPGGRLLLLEHVPDWPGAGRSLDLVGPAWRRVGGCDPARDIPAAVRAAGFNLWDLERFSIATVALPLRSWVAGVAVVGEEGEQR